MDVEDRRNEREAYLGGSSSRCATATLSNSFD